MTMIVISAYSTLVERIRAACCSSHAGAAHGASPACVWGSLRWGDNVEDEWMAAGLLLRLSERVPDASIRLWDADGEFLLIEAAYALPRWVKPETAANR